MIFDLLTKDKEQVYRKYLLMIVEKIKKQYYEMGLVASGEFERQLEILIDNDKLSILGAKHTIQMESGRKPGGFVSVKDIENWIRVKPGLPQVFKAKPKQFAFIIARKIAKEGIKVPNQFNKGGVVSKVVDDFLANDLQDMLNELGMKAVDRIKSDLIQVLKIAA